MSTYRNCSVCGKLFKICNTCRKDIDEEFQPRRVCCCLEHFYYHSPIIQYKRNKIDKEQAKEDLRLAIDTYGEVDFVDNIKDIVDEIFSEPEIKIDKRMSKKKTVSEKISLETIEASSIE